MENIELRKGDCLELMKDINDKSVDMILCDLPYGTTQNKWDSVIDLDLLWKQYKRIIKDNGIIVLTGQDKFSAKLMLSNEKMHRYNLIWDKKLISGFLNANRMPLRLHEDILIFYKKLGTYNPQFTEGEPLHSKGINYMNKEIKNQNYGKFKHTDDKRKGSTQKYPKSILSIQKPHPSKAQHPTEKPTALFEYLIKTYTNEGDLVLDNCAGSGTTGIACQNLNRNCIMMEKEEEYCEIILKRLKENKSLKDYTNK